MKKSFFLLSASLLLLLSTSCNPFSKCKESECGEHGDCKKGSCECEPGWAKDVTGKCELEELCYLKDCGPNGNCNDPNGNCDCNENYQVGASGKCDKLWRDSFIGTWYGSHLDGNVNHGPYSFTISANSAAITRITIDNFCDWDCATFNAPLSVIATVFAPGEVFEMTSTCSAYDVTGNARLIDNDNLFLEAQVYINTSGYHPISGNFQRQ